MKRFCVLLGILIAVTAVVAVLLLGLRGARPQQPCVAALWVTRFDYDTPEDVRRIIANVGAAGFTDVFFQIRGNGTAYYNSKLEPWAFELSNHNLARLGEDPGWDPLQLAIDSAKSYELLRVHAYMNVLPGWKGTRSPPEQAGQLWTAHRNWFMVDSLGNTMLPTSGWYAFVNPVLPEVRQHLRDIVRELCRYDIDGVHMDYIRYPHDYRLVAKEHYPEASEKELLRHADFSYDPSSQAALFQRYGWEVTKKEIADFRRDSVTKVVRDISYVMQVEKPGACLLSASVMGNPIEGRSHAYQDSGDWVRRNLVDWAVQMNYGTTSFGRYLENMRKAAGKKGFASSVVVGLNLKNDLSDVLDQIKVVQESGSRGIAFFSYTYLFDEYHQPTEKGLVLLPALAPFIQER